MPKQVFDAEEFLKLAEKASECRVVRRGDKVKLKLRTPKLLYTLATTAEQAETILKDVKAKVVEI